MIKPLYAPQHPEASKLEEAIDAIKRLGKPKIRATLSADGAYYAIEGTHRIAAANDLQVEIDVVETSRDDLIKDHGFVDLPDVCTAGEIVDYLYAKPVIAYPFKRLNLFPWRITTIGIADFRFYARAIAKT
jgi:hypothetical protein